MLVQCAPEASPVQRMRITSVAMEVPMVSHGVLMGNLNV
jgi:hypothetical protein